MIQKLLLVRVCDSRSGLLEDAGIRPFAGEPLPVSPRAWPDDAGLSHYGFALNGMKLKDWQALLAWLDAHPEITCLDSGGNVDEALAAVGLRINKSAEE